MDPKDRQAISREALRQWQMDARVVDPPEEFIFWRHPQGGYWRLPTPDADFLRVIQIDPS